MEAGGVPVKYFTFRNKLKKVQWRGAEVRVQVKSMTRYE